VAQRMERSSQTCMTTQDNNLGAPAKIEPATWRDINALRIIEKACFPKDAWPLWDLVGVLTLPNVVRLKAMVDGTMIGFIAGDVRPSQNVAWIATIGVLPEHRGKGIGSTLLQTCEKHLEVTQVRLNVRVSNQAAIRLYQQNGYQRAGVWPAYYQDGEDALVMEKRLS
jgi:ribosomal-protein-alanine acetyltransferase